MLVRYASDLGLCVRARRSQLKITQTTLARQVGVGRHWIIAFESGKPAVELSLALKTFEVLNLELCVFAAEPPAWTMGKREETV